MTTTDAGCPGLSDLIARLDRSVEAGSSEAITAAVKADLEYLLGGRLLSLPAAFIVAAARHLRAAPAASRSARPLYRDRHDVGTGAGHRRSRSRRPVVRGRRRRWRDRGDAVSRAAGRRTAIFRVTPIGSLLAGTGSAGCLIPPTDHHVLANARPRQRSVTLHVYGGDLDDCKVFLPATPDGRYAETTKTLSFHE